MSQAHRSFSLQPLCNSVPALKIIVGLRQTFTTPAYLQRITFRDVGGSTDGCRGSVQLVVEEIVTMTPVQFNFSCSVVRQRRMLNSVVNLSKVISPQTQSITESAQRKSFCRQTP